MIATVFSTVRGKDRWQLFYFPRVESQKDKAKKWQSKIGLFEPIVPVVSARTRLPAEMLTTGGQAVLWLADAAIEVVLVGAVPALSAQVAHAEGYRVSGRCASLGGRC